MCKKCDNCNNPVAKTIASIQNFASKSADTISKYPPLQQLGIGVVSGWGSGSLLMRLGKSAAFIAGGSVILFQLAQHQNLTKMDWEKLKEKAQNTSKTVGPLPPQLSSNVKQFARSNSYFAAGFIGGFLIGISH